ncbi:MAG TPA: signal peptidase I [Leifsonia sp.]|nr:signal peptidase I [Leifsonia sp.]
MVPNRSHDSGLTLRVLWAVLTAALLASVLLVGVFAVVVPAVTGSATYTILTSSMKPHLPPGTFVVVERENAADLRVGDVITYQLASGKPAVVTHRIVQVRVNTDNSRTFITRGDNNAVADPDAVRTAQIKGKVWYAIPFVGWMATMRNTSIGSTALTVAGWALLAYGVAVAALASVRRVRRVRESEDDGSPG